MTFHSILFDHPENDVESTNVEIPSFFYDLNLDQVFQSVTTGREEYNLNPFFAMPLNNVKTITYRQEILKDLEKETLRKHIESFAEKMHEMRENLARAERLSYKYQKERWFLDAVEIYCLAVSNLADDILHLNIKSRGLLTFRQYLKKYVNSDSFISLYSETKKIKDELSKITYIINIRGRQITVRKYEEEPDYSAKVEEIFKKFQQGTVKDYHFEFHDPAKMNHVDEEVMNRVARLYPDIFAALTDYNTHNRDYLNEVIRRFDREAQFYIAYLDFIKKFKLSGLKFCYPNILDKSKEVLVDETFDISLANNLIDDDSTVVRNDFYLRDPERILVVSGPNQGGKTTFARTFGQLHYLAKLGYPVPGNKANLFLCDHIFTHFEKEENIEDLRGKLQDELVRIHEILQQATSNSIVIVNEGFMSTTLGDAIYLGRKVLQQIIKSKMLCVYVTSIDELSTLSDATVSMMSITRPEKQAMLTYKIERRPADGRAYAFAIAEKYELTYESLKRRLSR